MAECSIRSLTALGFDLDAPRFQSPALFRAFVRENVITIPAAPRTRWRGTRRSTRCAAQS